MQRRNFFGSSLSAGLMQGTPEPQIEREYQSGGTGGVAYQVPLVIERKTAGKPHAGKVFAAIQPHCDDIPIFAGGLVLKLIDEGYTGYLITLSNDSMAGTGPTIGDIVLKNEEEGSVIWHELVSLHCMHAASELLWIEPLGWPHARHTRAPD